MKYDEKKICIFIESSQKTKPKPSQAARIRGRVYKFSLKAHILMFVTEMNRSFNINQLSWNKLVKKFIANIYPQNLEFNQIIFGGHILKGKLLRPNIFSSFLLR